MTGSYSVDVVVVSNSLGSSLRSLWWLFGWICRFDCLILSTCCRFDCFCWTDCTLVRLHELYSNVTVFALLVLFRATSTWTDLERKASNTFAGRADRHGEMSDESTGSSAAGAAHRMPDESAHHSKLTTAVVLPPMDPPTRRTFTHRAWPAM